MTKESSPLETRLTAADSVSMLLGVHDRRIKLIEETTETTIHTRGKIIRIIGEQSQISLVTSVIRILQELIKRGIHVGTPDVATALKMGQRGALDYFVEMYGEEIIKDRSGKPIRIKDSGQKKYVESVAKHGIVFGVGPARIGKTFLAVVLATAALKKGEVQKIILMRPIVEAGENLGSLPGDLRERVDPYLCLVYDALYQISGLDHTNRLMERGVIKITPLAYMWGQTLDDAFVILDEVQNTTVTQMKMFLTRLGYQSKMIVNGDTSQIDPPRGTAGGLVHAERTLKQIRKIDSVNFEASDVARHPVVAETTKAYEKADLHQE